MAEFVLELLSEEIPARMQAEAARRLAEGFRALCAEAGLAVGEVEGHAGPRRLAVLAQGLAAKSDAVDEERRGPREGAPEPAIEGFARSAGVARDALVLRDAPKGRFWFAERRVPARPGAQVLAERLPALVEGFEWPKAMRWGEASAAHGAPRWVRPLRRILCLVDEAHVPFAALGLTSGRATEGHRWMAPGAVQVPHAGAYAALLSERRVMLSLDERARAIAEGAARAAGAAGLALVADEALARENAGLVEWPVALVGRFDPAFLDVPPEIVTLTLKTHQRAFALTDADGRPAPAFVAIANLDAPDGGAAIRAGNERVIAARLADARFFWEQDRTKLLDEHAHGLDRMMFHERLGTMSDKTERVVALALAIRQDNPKPLGELDPAVIERAARLSRADLTTATVGEFPELQGIVGARLAEAHGEHEIVVEWLMQFHQPEPSDPANVVALADRLDTLIRFFAIGERPTGSRDPFALRRAGSAVVGMLLGHWHPVAVDHLPGMREHGVSEFLVDRLGQRLKEEAGAGDEGRALQLLAAVRAGGAGHEANVLDLSELAFGLRRVLDEPGGADLLAAYRRTGNILADEGSEDLYPVDEGRLHDGAQQVEVALHHALLTLSQTVDGLVKVRDFGAVFRQLARLRPLIDRFFDEVRVNADDPGVRANRLALLAMFRDAVHAVADLSRIQGA